MKKARGSSIIITLVSKEQIKRLKHKGIKGALKGSKRLSGGKFEFKTDKSAKRFTKFVNKYVNVTCSQCLWFGGGKKTKISGMIECKKKNLITEKTRKCFRFVSNELKKKSKAKIKKKARR